MAKAMGSARNFSNRKTRRGLPSSVDKIGIGQRVTSARNGVTGRVTGRVADFGGRGPAFRIRTRDGSVAAVPFSEVLLGR